MAIWLVRSGSNGEHEGKFLAEGKVYLTWDSLDYDLNEVENWEGLIKVLSDVYGSNEKRRITNWASQIWIFSKEINTGDWVVSPSKFHPTLHFGLVKSQYVFHPNNENPYYHSLDVDWFATDIPRNIIDQDILYSLGAFLTICKIARNDAEARLKRLYENKWNNKFKFSASENQVKEMDLENISNNAYLAFEETAYDQISEHIGRKFKGHRMAVLIEEILKAKGYLVYRSPEGPDKGVDLLASPDPLGFGSPKICIQVKTTSAQVDRPTLDQLRGNMSNFNADYGILVSWSGFKTSVYKEIPNQFFKVRLWDNKNIISELLSVYDKLLDETIKNEIPLKKIWTLTLTED